MPPINPYQSPAVPASDFLNTEVSLQRPIRLQGSMSLADVLHAQRVILQRRWPIVALFLIGYVLLVLTLALLEATSFAFSSTFVFLGLCVMPGILPLTLGMVYLRMRHDARHKTGLFSETDSTISDTGITSKSFGRVRELPWSSFRSFIASDRIIVLFLKQSSAYLIISRAKLLRTDEWPILCSFLRYKIDS